MQEENILEQMKNSGVVAVIRADTIERSIAVAKACIDGGIHDIELTYTVPGARMAIETLVHEFKDHPEILIGAGTVLNEYEANQAIKAGADFIVSPAFDRQVAISCNSAGIKYFPGCFTPTEVYRARSSGVSMVKIFPASVVGPSIIRELHGPFPATRIMPTGGVNLDNLTDWFDAGAYVVGVGGSLVGDSETPLKVIRNNARQFTNKYQSWKQKSLRKANV